MRRLVIPVVWVAAAVVPAWAQEEAQRISATNLAGRNRFMTQKTLKEALQVVLGIHADTSKEEIKKGIDLYEKTHQGLTHGSSETGIPTPSAPVAAELGKIDPLWAAYRQALEGVVAGAAEVDRLIATNAPLLAQAEAVVKTMEAELKTPASPVLSRAMRNRMLSQRMANYIYLVALKQEVEANRKALQETAATFDQVVKGLVTGDATLNLPAAGDPALEQQMGAVAKVWAEFRPLTEQAGKGELGGDALAQVATLSAALLAESNQAVEVIQAKAKGK